MKISIEIDKFMSEPGEPKYRIVFVKEHEKSNSTYLTGIELIEVSNTIKQYAKLLRLRND